MAPSRPLTNRVTQRGDRLIANADTLLSTMTLWQVDARFLLPVTTRSRDLTP